MANQQLIDYFKEGAGRGISLIKLKNDLLDSGWSEIEVSEAFEAHLTGVNRGSNVGLKLDYKILIIVLAVFMLIGIVIAITALSKGEDALTKTDLMAGKLVKLDGSPVLLELNGKTSTITLDSTYNDSIKVDINGIVIEINLTDKKIDLDFDGANDIIIRLERIKGDVPEIYLELSEEEVKTINDTIAEFEKFIVPEDFTIFMNGTCSQNWTCGPWAACTGNTQNRTCIENSGCNGTSMKPITNRSCGDDEYGCYIDYEPCFEPKGEFCDEGWDENDFDPYCCSGTCLEFDLDDFCEEKPDDYVYFEENETHVCSAPQEFPFNETMISCCERGAVVESYCLNNDMSETCSGNSVCIGGDVTILGNECCNGFCADNMIISNELRSVWSLIEISGDCTEQNISNSIADCSPYKCVSLDLFYELLTGEEIFHERGVVGMQDGFCHYYENYSERDGGELYCKYDDEGQNNASIYYSDLVGVENIEVNSSGYFLDGVEKVNYLQNALDEGVCYMHIPDEE